MSHCVSIKTQFKEINTLKKVFEKLGFSFQENSKIHTYAGDPKGNMNYPWVAVNPREKGRASGYDIGIVREEDGNHSLVCDFYDQGLSGQVGNNFNKVKTNYALEIINDYAINEGYFTRSEVLENGEVLVTVTD